MPVAMKTVFLLGPKHSGKTSAGMALSARCSCAFVDLDELVEQRSGKSPRALYAEGQDVFRDAEARAFAWLMEQNSGSGMRVVATGGGIADNPAALALLDAAARGGCGIGVYIRGSPATAWERIRRAGELPPFLRTENPEETHRALHERRSAVYQQTAALVVDAEGKSPQETADAIYAQLLQRGFLGEAGFFA